MDESNKEIDAEVDEPLTNGVEEVDKSATAVTILTNKPLVYNYDDTAADDCSKDSESMEESTENKRDVNTAEWSEASTVHSYKDDTSLPLGSESIEHTVINANEEIVVAFKTQVNLTEENNKQIKTDEHVNSVPTEEAVLDSVTDMMVDAFPEDSEELVSEIIETETVPVPADQFETVVILSGDNKTKDASEIQNAKNTIMDDWEPEDGSDNQDEEETEEEAEEEQQAAEEREEPEKTPTTEPPNGVALPRNLPKPRLFLAKTYLSRQEAVKEILKKKPAPLRSLLPKKDLILAMELAKHSTTGGVAEVDESEEILHILESDQVGDWRDALPAASEIRGNDTEIIREVNNTRGITNSNQNMRGKKRPGQPSMAKAAVEERRKARMIERQLALDQLAKEFKTKSRKRSQGRTLAVAAEDLERALSATPVLAGKRKRRPCYQPEEKKEKIIDEKSDDEDSKPSSTIKTYVPTPRSSDSRNDVETGLETIAIINRHLNADNNSEDAKKEPEDEQQVEDDKMTDKVKKKRPTRELQQLLGDEGAVRMLYDTAQKEEGQSTPMFKKTKKGLLQKTKFVEDAVLRASGASEKSLRGKRLNVSNEEKSPEESLFPPAAPGSAHTPGRSRKKPKPAEASRILYRHSSSESFDGSEGLRRSASEIAGLDNMSPERMPMASPAKTDGAPQRKSTRPRKVSSKLSAYIAEPVSQKKKDRKTEVVADTENKIEQPEVKTPSKVGKAAKTTNDLVRVTHNGSLVEIVLAPNQSTIKNGLRTQTILALKCALEDAKNNSSCKAVLFRTESKIFCQGIDLGCLSPNFDVNGLVDAIKEFTKTLANMEKPTIAGVQGSSVGMGVAMLPLFDVVVASDASTFWTPYARLGQGLEAGASFTFPHISRALVSELIYKGNVLSADEALHLGLITEVVPDKEFAEQLTRIAADIVAQSNQGLRMAKELLSNCARNSILEALERECASLNKSWTNPECLASISECLTSGEFVL